MIATANPYATQAGLAILRQGGSALDAAIAAQMVLTLVEPESSGIGGGAFLLLWDPVTGRCTSFNGRETAPAADTAGLFLDADGHPVDRSVAIPGGKSVGVPGVVAMLEVAHRRYGRLPWDRLFAPAIALAQEGFVVPAKLARTLRDHPDVLDSPDLRAHFTRPDGSPVQAGDTLKNPELAATFALLARDPHAFYSGPLAEAIADKVRHAWVHPGAMTVADLQAYRAQEQKPVCGPYRQHTVCSMGPPSSGGIAVVQILTMLERFPASSLNLNTVEGVHRFAQAARLAFADRAAYLGDPDFNAVPVDGLLDRRYLADRSRLIPFERDLGTATAGVPPGVLPSSVKSVREQGGTSHLSIIDDRGQAVSMTSSIEYFFGARLMAGGFVLNNQLTDFTFTPMANGKPVANAPAAFKRPLSAMSPTLVFDAHGQIEIVAGSPGGPSIISHVAETLIAMLDGGADPAAAIRRGQVIEKNGPLYLEDSPALNALIPELRRRGYDIQRPVSGEGSALNVIQRTPTGFVGASDPRSDGIALGD